MVDDYLTAVGDAYVSFYWDMALSKEEDNSFTLASNPEITVYSFSVSSREREIYVDLKDIACVEVWEENGVIEHRALYSDDYFANFMRETKRLAYLNEEAKAIDHIYDTINGHLIKHEFDAVKSIIDEFQFEMDTENKDLSNSIYVGVLTITYVWKKFLSPQRDKLYLRIFNNLKDQKGFKEAAAILFGLR